MSYDPHDYMADSRRLGAGFSLAGAVVLGLFAICPSESISLLQENIFRQGDQRELLGESQGRVALIGTTILKEYV